MEFNDPFVAIAILLAAALVGGTIAHRLRQPIILGYLVVGVAVGPHALGLVGDVEIVEAAATIGVALLMLTLGLEISVVQLREVGRVGVIGGLLQVLLTIGLGVLAGRLLFGWPFPQAVLFGLIISLSSTAVCLKVLMDRGVLEGNDLSGSVWGINHSSSANSLEDRWILRDNTVRDGSGHGMDVSNKWTLVINNTVTGFTGSDNNGIRGNAEFRENEVFGNRT